jgi:site-specific recombinase XerD
MLGFDSSILAGQIASASVCGYQYDLIAYQRFCDRERREMLDAASLARWRQTLAEDTQLSPRTINRMLSAVKSIIKEGAMQGYVDHAKAEALRRVSGASEKALKGRLKVPTRLTPPQMRRLVDAPDRTQLRGWRDRALLSVLASSGCRISEVITVTSTQIRSEAGSFFVEVLGKNQTTSRLAPLSHEAFAAVQAWLARRPVESRYVFTSTPGNGSRSTPRPLDRSAAWRIVARYAGHVGLQHVSPHSFRRFVGTELAKKDIRQAQKALGHARIETTARHYVLDELAGGLTDHLF